MFQSKLSFETVFILVFPGIAQYFPLMPEFAWAVFTGKYRYLPAGISQGGKYRPTLIDCIHHLQSYFLQQTPLKLVSWFKRYG